jgi:hypothetical protein
MAPVSPVHTFEKNNEEEKQGGDEGEGVGTSPEGQEMVADHIVSRCQNVPVVPMIP